MDFSDISDTGVIGDPTRASRDAGSAIWERCVEAGVQTVLDILAGNEVHQTWRFLEAEST